jgi:hypothetical protein
MFVTVVEVDFFVSENVRKHFYVAGGKQEC